MIEKRCPGCLNPFDTFTWKKINGYYKCPCCGGIHDMDALDLDNKDKRYDLLNRKVKIYRLLKIERKIYEKNILYNINYNIFNGLFCFK